MGETTKISWADSTWNPVTGCTKVSPGCLHCFTSDMAERIKNSVKNDLAYSQYNKVRRSDA